MHDQHLSHVMPLAFHPYAPYIAIGNKAGEVDVWRLGDDIECSDPKLIATMTAHSNSEVDKSVLAVAFGQSGRFVTGGFKDAKVWQ